MWIVQHGSLLRFPDDAPLPHGSVKIKVPEDFHQNPSAYVLKNNALVRRPERDRPAQANLTAEDVARIKKAIAEGRV